MTLTVLVPIFALLALGFAAARSGLLSAEANAGLLKLVACFAIPALLFRSLTAGVQASNGGEIALIYLLGCAALLVIAFVYGRAVLGLSLAECVIYSNSSLIGVPIAQALLGDQGVALLSQIIAIHTLVLIPMATLLLAFGSSAGGGSKALIAAISNPITLALAAGLVWRRTGLAAPEMIDHVIGMLAAAAPALSLIALGATVARVPLPTSFAAPVASVVLKLVVHPLLIWSIAQAIGLPREQILIATMTAALPPGINVYVLAAHFGRHAEDAARSFALATTLSAVSISVVVQAIAWR